MKNKDEIMGVTIAFFVTIFMIWMTRWKTYIDAMDNFLFIFLLVFMVCVVFGYGVSKLFNMKGKKGDKFILD